MKKIYSSLIIAIIGMFSLMAQEPAYVSGPSEPWSQNSNILAMETIYGVQGTDWFRYNFYTATVSEIFTADRPLVFIEGGDSYTSTMLALLSSDWPAIAAWISAGNTLIVNAATNQSLGKVEIGSSGIFSERILTNTMQAYVDATAYPESPNVHPLLTSESYPAYAAGDYVGNYIAHNVITGDYTSSVFTCSNGNTLVEKEMGSGRLIVGGLTLPFFITYAGWAPQPQCGNFLYSMLDWTSSLSQGNVFHDSTAFDATMPQDGTGYWIVVPAESATPTEQQIKDGVDYGSVTIIASGSKPMTANVSQLFGVEGLTPGTDYTLYFVTQNTLSEFSAITNFDFTTDLDTDGDDIGDNLDDDDDGDGTLDEDDDLPLDGTEVLDTDGDGIGNNMDLDDDGDGTLDTDDAFPLNAAETLDTDSDGIGNNADTDDDGDGTLDTDDTFPLDATETIDTDSDGIGNNADTDDDGDGVADVDDLFPLDATETLDTDSDGIGNNADTDDDGDGTLDADDAFPLD
ncbi:MAG: hypothetical protein K9H12_15990, partial [Bacteroidales bacterium]|nr:hypothetical protein [Bacteroidales bacterium]